MRRCLKMQVRKRKSVFNNSFFSTRAAQCSSVNKVCSVLLCSFKGSVRKDYQTGLHFCRIDFEAFFPLLFRWSLLMSLCCKMKSIDLTKTSVWVNHHLILDIWKLELRKRLKWVWRISLVMHVNLAMYKTYCLVCQIIFVY